MLGPSLSLLLVFPSESVFLQRSTLFAPLHYHRKYSHISSPQIWKLAWGFCLLTLWADASLLSRRIWAVLDDGFINKNNPPPTRLSNVVVYSQIYSLLLLPFPPKWFLSQDYKLDPSLSTNLVKRRLSQPTFALSAISHHVRKGLLSTMLFRIFFLVAEIFVGLPGRGALCVTIVCVVVFNYVAHSWLCYFIVVPVYMLVEGVNFNVFLFSQLSSMGSTVVVDRSGGSCCCSVPAETFRTRLYKDVLPKS